MSREVFTTCNPLAVSCVLYQEEARTTLWGAGIYYDGVTCWDVNSSGVIIGTAVCTTTSTTSTTSTTTGAPVEYQIDNAASGTSNDACNGATTTSLVYASPGNTVPYVSMILYDSTALTTPFVGSSGWRKLTGPLDTYAVEIDVNGEITNYVTC